LINNFWCNEYNAPGRFISNKIHNLDVTIFVSTRAFLSSVFIEFKVFSCLRWTGSIFCFIRWFLLINSITISLNIVNYVCVDFIIMRNTIPTWTAVHLFEPVLYNFFQYSVSGNVFLSMAWVTTTEYYDPKSNKSCHDCPVWFSLKYQWMGGFWRDANPNEWKSSSSM